MSDEQKPAMSETEAKAFTPAPSLEQATPPLSAEQVQQNGEKQAAVDGQNLAELRETIEKEFSDPKIVSGLVKEPTQGKANEIVEHVAKANEAALNPDSKLVIPEGPQQAELIKQEEADQQKAVEGPKEPTEEEKKESEAELNASLNASLEGAGTSRDEFDKKTPEQQREWMDAHVADAPKVGEAIAQTKVGKETLEAALENPDLVSAKGKTPEEQKSAVEKWLNKNLTAKNVAKGLLIWAMLPLIIALMFSDVGSKK